MGIIQFLAVILIAKTRDGENVSIKKKKQAKTFQLTKRVHFDMQTKFNVKLHKLDQ